MRQVTITSQVVIIQYNGAFLCFDLCFVQIKFQVIIRNLFDFFIIHNHKYRIIMYVCTGKFFFVCAEQKCEFFVAKDVRKIGHTTIARWGFHDCFVCSGWGMLKSFCGSIRWFWQIYTTVGCNCCLFVWGTLILFA